MDAPALFESLTEARLRGEPRGICSVCSASPYVLEAAMEQAAEDGAPLLIEATANQVDQFGGYTGMTPPDFAGFVLRTAQSMGFPGDRILLGGDHLGPLTWKNRPEREAMALAEELVRQYVLAGFGKIHLDTSMHLADDDPGRPLPDAVVARRGAVLCAAAEQAADERRARHPDAAPPVYVIGSEVPTPGGMQQQEDTLTPTSPAAFVESYRTFERVFAGRGLRGAFDRVVAFVVQPGVEFSGDSVFEYSRDKAAALCASLRELDRPLLFEGHSTDYQRPALLRQMVEDGVAILKVGPALTFALREGLVALELVEKALLPGSGLAPSGFSDALEAAMLQNPKNWEAQYAGDQASQKLQRVYSYYDRARYYLAQPGVAAATETLLCNLEQTGIPLQVLSQYLPLCYRRCREGLLRPEPRAILRACVRECLRDYAHAVSGRRRKTAPAG